MTDLTIDVQHTVADRVARKWASRGISYPYDDLYQDAIEVCHLTAPQHDDAKGDLHGYLYSACIRVLAAQVTRFIQPAGTRSNDEVKHLRKLRTVRVVDEHLGADPEDPDETIYRAQVRQRLATLSEDVPEGNLALAILLDMTSVKEQADGDDHRAQRLYYCVRRMKKALREDTTLALMAGEGAKA